jgi:carboxyl-terminal processing protease
MKLIHILLLLFVFNNSYLVKGQNVENSKPNENEIKNLSNLCKVWGFLKYYHPNVAKGNFNWDEHLLTILPKIENSKNSQEISKIYIDWIDSLGEIKECKTCKTINSKDSFDNNFDLSWTQDSNVFSDELTRKLKYIENNRFQGKSYYISTTSNGNVVIENEPEYKDFEYPSRNFRLLSLFKYWNTIEYFYPYKYLTDQNWNDVLMEMIPKFINSKSASEYHLAMLETVIKLDDTHANFYTKKIHEYFGLNYIPIRFKVIESKAVITSFYNDSLAKINDLRIGDILEKIDGKNVREIIFNNKKYINGSNDNVKSKNYDFTVFNGFIDSANLTIKRNEIDIHKQVGRYNEELFKNKKILNPEKYKILENNIGYINMANLEMKDVDKMMLSLKSTKAIIIDLRNYPNFIPFLIARRLIQTKKSFVKFIEPDLSYYGKFKWRDGMIINPIKNEYYKGVVILLVNEETQSATEFSTMLLQIGDNVITIGSQTAGADGNISKIEFLGFKSFISGIGVYYPDNSETQRKGVKIDIEVNQTIKGIQEGRDEILEKALEYLR